MKIRVRLLRDHIVNAKTFKAGMVVNLSPAAAEFVIAQDVGELADAPPPLTAVEPTLDPQPLNPDP